MAGVKVRRIDHWPDEFLVGIAGLTWEESGAYRVICDLIYSSGRNIFSDDPRLVTFGGGHRNRVNAVISRLESMGKITTIPVETPRILQGNTAETARKRRGICKEISVMRCTHELENARKRLENARNLPENERELSKINGLGDHARAYTRPRVRPRAGDSNLQPSTFNLQPPTRARAREEGDSKNGWKKVEPFWLHNPAHAAGCQCNVCERCGCETCQAARAKSANLKADKAAAQKSRQSKAAPYRPQPAETVT